ncbi:unnamed protein product [Arctogadus glacialis]
MGNHIAAERHSKKMPLGDECHDWKKKTTDVKENYDFKDVLGTQGLYRQKRLSHRALQMAFQWYSIELLLLRRLIIHS